MALYDIIWILPSGKQEDPVERTAEQLCTYIVETFKKHDKDLGLTPKELWELDPTGGIVHLFGYLHQCKELEGCTCMIEMEDGTYSPL